MIGDITWNASAVYASPDPGARFVAWWTHEYFMPAAAQARAAYDEYHALLDTPDKLWYASEAVQNLIERLWRRVTGQPFTPFDADTLAVLQSRIVRLDSALAAAARAESSLSRPQRRFFSVDVALGLRVDERQSRAALNSYPASTARPRI